VLVPLYALILCFIIISAVSTRWHYVVDLPVGLALAWVSVWLAGKVAPSPETVEAVVVPAAIPPVDVGAIGGTSVAGLRAEIEARWQHHRDG
jgi:hypothetical protein